MEFIGFLVIFLINFIINVFYLLNGVLPLFWLPYVIYKIIKHEYRLSAIMLCVFGPIFWFFILMGVGYVFTKTQFLNNLLYSKPASIGTICAFIAVIFSPKQEFKNALEKYKV